MKTDVWKIVISVLGGALAGCGYTTVFTFSGMYGFGTSLYLG